MKIGISRKILLLIESIVLTVIILGGVSTIFVLQRVVVQEANDKLKTISDLKAASLRLYLDEELEEFEFAANNKLPKETLERFINSKKAEDKAKVLDLLKSMNYEGDSLVNSSLLDVDGNVLVSSDPQEEGKVKAEKKYFIAGKIGGNTALDYEILLGTPVLVFAAPIKNAEGDLEAVIIKRAGLGEINKTMSARTGLGQTGETFLVNSSNLVISDLLKETDAAYKKTIYLPQIVNCLSGDQSLSEQTDYHGDAVFGHWTLIPELASCLVTKIDRTEVLSPIADVSILFFSVLILIGLIGGVLGYLFSKSLVRPIIQLRDETLRIKQGNVEKAIEIKTNDEIGDLAAAFNEMENKIKEEQMLLQKEVEEKTKQLNIKLKELTELYSSSEKMNELMIGRELSIIDLKKKNSLLEAELVKKDAKLAGK